MKAVTRYELHDGTVHKTEKDAQRRLDVLEADLLCPIVYRLMDSKCSEIQELLLNELPVFEKLIAIRNDRLLVDDEEQHHDKT